MRRPPRLCVEPQVQFTRRLCISRPVPSDRPAGRTGVHADNGDPSGAGYRGGGIGVERSGAGSRIRRKSNRRRAPVERQRQQRSAGGKQLCPAAFWISKTKPCRPMSWHSHHFSGWIPTSPMRLFIALRSRPSAAAVPRDSPIHARTGRKPVVDRSKCQRKVRPSIYPYILGIEVIRS